MFLKKVALLTILQAGFLAYAQEEGVSKKGGIILDAEFYPLNVVSLRDPVIKSEMMADYRSEFKSHFDFRFHHFSDGNFHYAGERNLQDLIQYTETSVGWKMLQIGAEVGSVSGVEYLSVGPQLTTYEFGPFEMAAVVSRLSPDLVLGYEYVSKELVFGNMSLSSTGTGRILPKTNRLLIQASAWMSFKKLRRLSFGIEYEYNNGYSYLNGRPREKPHELFGGVKMKLF